MSVVATTMVLITFPALSQVAPVDPIQWKHLNPSNPEHAIIISWHGSLLNGDFDAYRLITPRFHKEDNYIKARYRFERRRRNAIPREIVIHIRSRHNNLIELGAAGCGDWPGFDQPIRLVANVTLVNESGQMKVSASDFAPPWNNLVRICPKAN